MAMFGAPRNPFDPAAMFAASQGMPATGQLSPFGMSATPQAAAPMPPLMGAPAEPAPPMLGQGLMASGAPAAPKRPGFNDPGGWADKLAMISAALGSARGDPNAGVMVQLMQQKRDHADKMRLAEQAKYAPQHVGDAIIHLDPATGRYVTDYAPQQAPHTGGLETNYNFLKGIDPNLADQYVKGQANPLMGIDVTQPDGSVQRMFYPRSGMPSSAPSQSGPAVGTVEGGYRFKGGNPADPKAWEAVTGGAGSSAPRTFP